MFQSFICVHIVTTSISSILALLVDNDVIDLSHFGPSIYGKPIEIVGDQSEAINYNIEEEGPYLEGDLLIPVESKNGMKAESLRWKNGEVPFEIRGSFNAFNMDMIEKAINEYHKKTCIRFIPRRPSDRDFISIENGSSGCWSSVGRIGGKQVVNLQTNGCVSKKGTIIHEFLHALGFLHEQNRDDRDSFVIIRKNNIKQGYEVNFSKAKPGETTAFGVKYDFGSVLHYSTTAFSKNGQPTIEAKSSTNEKIGQREGFSPKDIEKVNKMYKCQLSTSPVATTTKNPTLKPTAKPSEKPSEQSFPNIFEIFFPSNWDEEEILS